ncbi:MAG: hypothetical protein ACRCR1_05390 [Aeromonas sp.]
MNTYTDDEGLAYIAVESKVSGMCKGCDFQNKPYDSACDRLLCSAADRQDNRDVIWRNVGECVDPVNIELTFAATDRIDAVRNTVARLRAIYEPHFTVGKTEITRRGDHIIVSIPVGTRK